MLVNCFSSSAELTERLSDYPHCTPSLLSLPHPVTPSHSTEATPTHDKSCMASDSHSETETSDLNNAPSSPVSGNWLCVE